MSKVEVATADALAQQTGRLGFGDGGRQTLRRQGIFAADEEVGVTRADAAGRDGHALQQPVRAGLHQRAVLEGARFAFVRVADQPARRRRGSAAREEPLAPGGEGRAAAPDQAGLVEQRDDFFRRQRQGMAQGGVIAVFGQGLRTFRLSASEQYGRFRSVDERIVRLRRPAPAVVQHL